MADATSQIVAATVLTVAGVTSTVHQTLGVDPIPLIWGFAGGCAALLGQNAATLRSMLVQLTASAMTAGALTQFVAFYIGRMFDAPVPGVISMVAFLLGVTAQSLIPALQSNVPALVSAIIGRFSAARLPEDKK